MKQNQIVSEKKLMDKRDVLINQRGATSLSSLKLISSEKYAGVSVLQYKYYTKNEN